jgi:hypothetical protein
MLSILLVELIVPDTFESLAPAHWTYEKGHVMCPPSAEMATLALLRCRHQLRSQLFE